MWPKLLFPIRCVIEALDQASTYYDEDLREPIQSEARSQDIIIPAQVMATSSGKMDASNYGVTAESDGYILVSYVDLKTRNYTPQLQDRIKKIGFLNVDYYVIGLQPMAFRTENNGPGFLKLMYRDKQKSRNNPGI